jgi:hypothetical protein
MILRPFACLGAVVLFLTGCDVNSVDAGPTQRESKSIDLDKSEMVRADLKMAAGELRISGGASKLMEADFAYNVPQWKPEVRYSATGFRGELSVEQPSGSPTAKNSRNEWIVRFNDSVPMDLAVKFGAGEGKLNLASLSLRSVQVEMGAGTLEMDLRGQPKRDYDVRIRGGVGQATVRLPRDAGIQANATGGLGSINVRGLTKKEGDRYENDAYEHAKFRIHVDVKGGIGNINLYAE